jgi:hypothetical protein
MKKMKILLISLVVLLTSLSYAQTNTAKYIYRKCDSVGFYKKSNLSIMDIKIDEIDSTFFWLSGFTSECSFYRNTLIKTLIELYDANYLHVKVIDLPNKFIEISINTADGNTYPHEDMLPAIADILKNHYRLDIYWEDDTADIYELRVVDFAKLIKFDRKKVDEELVTRYELDEQGRKWYTKWDMPLGGPSVGSLCQDIINQTYIEVVLDETVIDKKGYNFKYEEMSNMRTIEEWQKYVATYGLELIKVRRLRSFFVIKHIENQREWYRKIIDKNKAEKRFNKHFKN